MEYVLKPSVTKNFIYTLIKVLVVAGLIIGIVYFLDYIVGLEVFTDLLRDLAGINIEKSAAISVFSSAILIVSGLAVIIAYFGITNTSYTFGDRSFEVKQGLGKGKVIPYQNIAKLSIDESGIQGFVGLGTLVFELNAMKPDKIVAEYIDKVQEQAKNIQQLIENASMQRYYQYQQNQRIGGILDGLDEK